MPPFGRRDNQPRSAAEREAARLERDRRRAEREGRAIPGDIAPASADAAAHQSEPHAAPDGAGDQYPEPQLAPAEEAEPRAEPSPVPAGEPEPAREQPSVAWPDHGGRWAGPQGASAPQGPERQAAEPAGGHAAEPADADAAEPAEPRAAEPRPGAPAPATPPHPQAPAAGTPAPEAAPPAGDDDAEPWPSPTTPASAAARAQAADAAGRPAEPQETQPFDALGDASGRRTVSLPRPQTDTGEWEAPIGTVRRSRTEGYQAQPGAAGYPAYRKLGVQKPRRRWLRRLAALFAVGAVIGIAVFLYMLYQPAHGPGHGRVDVRIPEGATAAQIGDILAERGVVDSGFFFSLRARMSGQREELRSGRYTLRESMPYDAALVALTTAPKAVPVINVTLPEGPSRREAAALVRRAGVRGDYLAATRRSSRLRLRDYGAPSSVNTLEGFLFPATYELRTSQATARRLVSRQLDAFKDAFAKVDMREARRRNLTRYDVLIIASMIEREGLVARERRLISAVIYNRLREGMPLGIDATIRYALNNWSRPLRVSELQRDTPYNTRTRKGLPPTPIGNPGLAAMRAAANPANVDYLFYVVKPCGNGAHAFSSTDAQFQRDVAAYNRARDRRGGRDPSRC